MTDPLRTDRPQNPVARQAEEYKEGSTDRLGGYVTALSTYGATVIGLGALVAARRGGNLPAMRAGDIGLIAAATFRLTRTISKDAITSPLRAAFTTYEGRSDTPAEVKEKPRGSGLRLTLGELLSCPFCLSQWIGTGFTFGLVLAPRATRLAASALTAIAGADFLQFAYVGAQKKAEG